MASDLPGTGEPGRCAEQVLWLRPSEAGMYKTKSLSC